MHHNVPTRGIPKALRRNYRKRTVNLFYPENGRASVRIDPLWQGGSKEEYTFFRHNGAQWARVSRDQAADIAPVLREDGRPVMAYGMAYETATLRPGCVCVVGGVFCGKPATISIHGAREDIARIMRGES